MRNFPNLHAAAAPGLSRRGALARALAVGGALCACMAGVQAAPDQDQRPQHGERGQAPRLQEQPRMQDAQRADPRMDALRQDQMRAYEEQRRAALQAQQQQQQAQQDGFRRNGRLTPDERRDLRRQINEAGQDIYANTPRR